MLTKEQIEQRKSFIGGSDIAAVLGMSRWKTPLQIWGEKTGLLAPEDISKKLPVRVGNRLEDTVCEIFEEETGKKLAPGPGTVFHPSYPFLGATVDRMVVDEDAIFEAKTAGAFKADEWAEDEWPAEYLLQVLWYLAITGKQTAYIGCLIGNNKFVWKEVGRQEKTIARMIERAVTFWEKFVIPQVMPEVTGRDRETLSALFPVADEGKVVELDSKAAAICEVLEGMEADLRGLTRQVEEQKNQLRVLLGDAERGTCGDWVIHWANIKSKRLDMKALKETAPDVMAKCYKETTTRRFLVGKANTELLEKDNAEAV